MYKYNCRKCPIRSRCIDESDNPTATKIMLRRAFSARTDTLATWGFLQKRCLLAEAENQRSSTALSDRLQQVRDARKKRVVKPPDAKKPAPQIGAGAKKSVIRRIKPLKKPGQTKVSTDKLSRTPTYLQPVTPDTAKQTDRPVRSLRPRRPRPAGKVDLFWLTIESSGRHVALPTDGEIVLGRFDPNFGIPPDIDLSYEDQHINLISRRHAKITGYHGEHVIEDLGSRVGVLVGGEQIRNNPEHLLKRGDRIEFGGITLVYDRIPEHLLVAARTNQVKHSITVTPTGRQFSIDSSKNVIIGRGDPNINFMPDIDLSEEGQLAQRVSRRHALIHWQNNQPFIEDLGSGFGTRLHGETLPLGVKTPLNPGDHVWLAGCVLVYDVSLA